MSNKSFVITPPEPREPCPPEMHCFACFSTTGPHSMSLDKTRVYPVDMYRNWDNITDVTQVGHQSTVWRMVEPFLLAHGYRLYQSTLLEKNPKELLGSGMSALVRPATDANGLPVYIKSLPVNDPTHDELRIWLNMSSETALRDPRNHTAPIRDVLHCTPTFLCYHPSIHDERAFLVTEKFIALQDNPKFTDDHVIIPDIRTNLGYIKQVVLEGIEYLHSRGFAHGDIGSHNVVLTKTPSGRPRYLIIDFELSSVHPLPLVQPRHVAPRGINNAGPEHSVTVPYDPFPNDVFATGLFIETRYKLNLDAHDHEAWDQVPGIKDLVKEMTSPDPQQRPSVRAIRRAIGKLSRTLPGEVLGLNCITWGRRGTLPTLDEAFASL